MIDVKRWARLTPLTIAAVGVLLPLKLVDLGRALFEGGSAGAAIVSGARAESAAPAGPAAPEPPPVSLTAAAAPLVTEPTISQAERQLLQDLRTRREALDARERTLAQREGVLDAAEHRLTGRIAEMQALQARLEQLEAARRAHDEANWSSLVKMYETMKPKEAAAIFNEMDMSVLLSVIDRMRDTKAAQVLGAMQPDRARLVTAQLAAQRTRGTTVPPDPASPG